MPGFSGKFHHQVDSKGRLMLPSELRTVLQTNYNNNNTLYITLSATDKCLHIYPLEEWQRLQDKVRSLPPSKKSVKYYMRRVIASAHECELDKQGRILIPVDLREDASINGETVVVGQIDKIEVWNRAEWDKLFDPENIDISAYEAELAEMGL
ncbi:MAG: division/cell wall cluster transcriptional repressor MraZ [Nitrospirae bacterium]|nr:division/cell wall cluster transcriptional repressor MraZ [Nitrospirota bacterium]